MTRRFADFTRVVAHMRILESEPLADKAGSYGLRQRPQVRSREQSALPEAEVQVQVQVQVQ